MDRGRMPAEAWICGVCGMTNLDLPPHVAPPGPCEGCIEASLAIRDLAHGVRPACWLSGIEGVAQRLRIIADKLRAEN